MKINYNIVIVFVLLVYGSLILINTYYDDPDSFYYKSISEHIEQSDNTVLGDVLYESHNASSGKLFLYFMTIVCAIMLSLMLNTIKQRTISLTFFLFTPFCLFYNSWFARLDKNILEIFLFICLIYLLSFWKGFSFKNREQIISNIAHIIFSILFYAVAVKFWQGSFVFLIFQASYFLLYHVFYTRRFTFNNKDLLIYILLVIILTGLVIKFYPVNMSLVAEGRSSLAHMLIPELGLFIVLYYLFFKDLYFDDERFFTMSFIILVSVFIMPRLMLFIIPCLAYIIAKYYEEIILYLGTFRNYVILLLIIFGSVNMYYFTHDHHKDLKELTNPCLNITNCVLITDWSYGHIYRNLWNVSVMFIGHPSDPDLMLDYLYYRNMSCTSCVKLWHPRDYSIFDMYIETLGKEKIDQYTSDEIIIEVYE